MASGKLSPRQKMINMMYLVLIALLALNISNEILKAFHLMEVSFNKANQTLTDKNKAIMDAFKAAEEDPAKAVRSKKWADKAREVQKISSDFFQKIEVYKKDIETAAGGRKEAEPGETGIREMSKGDDMEGHKHYLGTDDVKPGKGDELRKLIDDTRGKMLKVLEGIKDDKATIAMFDKNTAFRVEDFKDDNGAKKTWERDVLGHSPVAGVMAMLTKVQNDAKSLETDILTKLAENIDATVAKFDKTAALIIAESTNVMEGSQFKAKVALMAYNSTAATNILVNGQKVTVVDGIGEYTQTASGVGSHKIEAKVETIDPNTGLPTYVAANPIEWTSFKSTATISADAMNVLYVGLDNPMSISVPGVTPANTTVTAGAGLSLTKSGEGRYIAKVTGGKETTISVSAKMPDGTSKRMGEPMKFRIKNVPKPVAQLGTLQSGPYQKGEIAIQNTLYAYLDGFVFDGVKFTVTKYRVIFMPKRGYMEEQSVNGNGTAAIKGYASKAKTGDMLVIEGIRATGPGGEKALQPITYTFK
jgi:gliding motility-associated protein GldM